MNIGYELLHLNYNYIYIKFTEKLPTTVFKFLKTIYFNIILEYLLKFWSLE